MLKEHLIQVIFYKNNLKYYNIIIISDNTYVKNFN